MTDTIARFCAEYHDYHRISPDRRTMQSRVLLEFDATVDGGLLAAGGPELQSFLSTRLESLAPTTVRRELGAIRPFFTWAWRSKLIDADRLREIEDVRPPRGSNGNGRPRPYTHADLQRFWATLEKRYPLTNESYLARWRKGTSPWRRVQSHAMRLQLEAVTSLALYGGMRRDEILRLTLDGIHPDNDVVVATSRKNREAEWVERAVPMFEPMRDALWKWVEFRTWLAPDHDEPWLSLWRNHHRKPIQDRKFRLLLHDLGGRSAAGNNGFEFHRMRHTAATELLRAGMPIHMVQRILGHARIEQTLAYAELLDGDVIQAAQKAESRYVRALGRTHP